MNDQQKKSYQQKVKEYDTPTLEKLLDIHADQYAIIEQVIADRTQPDDSEWGKK